MSHNLILKIGNNKVLRLVKGDITERNVDAIVNAANSYLKHGGCVAAAIVRKGGTIVQEESDKIIAKTGIVSVGSAVSITAGNLPCKAVIHTVGPKMGEGNEDYKLREAVRSSLLLASEKGFRSISMPAISSGIFGFPKGRCAKILVGESKTFLQANNSNDDCGNNKKDTTPILDIIEFCICDDETLYYFENEFVNINNRTTSDK
ncbi:MAG TPA: macro domain-containing protein [Nitrososphaeraceae archaeon]|nr:macro domain-containing protein [Nitrososphaeraceae archaeon]